MMGENKLPDGWVWTTLANVTFPTRMSVQPTDYPTLPFVGMEHVEAETMRLLGTLPASELKSNALHFYSDDVLYGRLRPYLNKVLHADFEGLCSAEFLVFRESSNLEARYLQYFLNAWSFKEFASHLNEGDRPRVDWSQLKEFAFPLAPLPEQHRIVAALEQQFTRLDAGVAALKSAQTRLKRYRATVLKAAVEGKLTEAWRAEHLTSEPASQLLARILQERRAKWEADLRAKGKDPAKVKYVEPAMPNVSKLPELPQGWSYTLLQPLLSVERKGMMTGPFGMLLKKHEHKKEGVPVLGIENIAAMQFKQGSKIYITKDKAEELSQYDAQRDDILISRSGTVGEVCVVPDYLDEARISTNLIRVALASSGMRPQYFCLLFNGSPTVLNQVSDLCKGSTRNFLSQTILSSIVFPLPPLEEQQQIVSEVERRLSIVSQLEVMVEANLKRAERLRQSILKEAFAGRLVPQDPDDEPASVLLERIRHEREVRGERKQSRTGQRQTSEAVLGNAETEVIVPL